MTVVNPVIDKRGDDLGTSAAGKRQRFIRHTPREVADNRVSRDALRVDGRSARLARDPARQAETMRMGMVPAGCAAGFALSRGVSFQGFLPAFPTIVSTNQKMP